LVHAAIDRGINYIDTAYVYMRGVNEETVGKVMQTKRDKVFLTTKVLRREPENMREMVQTSLKRLKTDHVDLLLLHGAGSKDDITNENYLKILDWAKKEGMTRFVGVSTHSNQPEVLEAITGNSFWDGALVGYNYMTPPSVQQTIEKARNAGLAIIAMKNLLTSSWPAAPLEDMRKDTTGKISKAQAFIKWVLDDRNVDTTVPGMTSFEHLDEDMAIMGMPMKFGERRTLDRYGAQLRGRYCAGVAGCTECMDQCPMGVLVCELNRCIGYADGYGDIDLARENYRELPSSNRVDMCGDCDECTVKCVNGLDLNKTVQRARELFA
ncbi:aldo/keto reductase, partial [Candidatus Latescibacterota bacterium]